MRYRLSGHTEHACHVRLGQSSGDSESSANGWTREFPPGPEPVPQRPDFIVMKSHPGGHFRVDGPLLSILPGEYMATTGNFGRRDAS
jgi:hypothetical protein